MAYPSRSEYPQASAEVRPPAGWQGVVPGSCEAGAARQGLDQGAQVRPASQELEEGERSVCPVDPARVALSQDVLQPRVSRNKSLVPQLVTLLPRLRVG